mmetsp:Transcript_81840/g.171172  ORF Transcript_81840/g.171172 Transcript_81840/m.171172 type:complete len:304 (-) Transcript_81840:2749-3660(-)
MQTYRCPTSGEREVVDTTPLSESRSAISAERAMLTQQSRVPNFTDNSCSQLASLSWAFSLSSDSRALTISSADSDCERAPAELPRSCFDRSMDPRANRSAKLDKSNSSWVSASSDNNGATTSVARSTPLRIASATSSVSWTNRDATNLCSRSVQESANSCNFALVAVNVVLSSLITDVMLLSALPSASRGSREASVAWHFPSSSSAELSKSPVPMVTAKASAGGSSFQESSVYFASRTAKSSVILSQSSKLSCEAFCFLVTKAVVQTPNLFVISSNVFLASSCTTGRNSCTSAALAALRERAF